jgi:hypothetical protein
VPPPLASPVSGLWRRTRERGHTNDLHEETRKRGKKKRKRKIEKERKKKKRKKERGKEKLIAEFRDRRRQR